MSSAFTLAIDLAHSRVSRAAFVASKSGHPMALANEDRTFAQQLADFYRSLAALLQDRAVISEEVVPRIEVRQFLERALNELAKKERPFETSDRPGVEEVVKLLDEATSRQLESEKAGRLLVALRKLEDRAHAEVDAAIANQP